MNKLLKNKKILLILLSTTLFYGCGKEKTIILNDDAKAEQIAINNNPVKVQEKFLDLNLKKNEIFDDTFYCGDSLLGSIRLDGKEIMKDKTKEYSFFGMKPNFHILNKNGELKEANKKLRNLIYSENGKAFYFDKIKNSVEGNSFLNYIDELNGIDKRHIIKYKDLYKEEPMAYELMKTNGKLFTHNHNEEIVEGKENFIGAYSHIEYKDNEKDDKFFIKVFDMERNKLYESDNINVEITKLLYIKSIDSFIAIDNKATCYKVALKNNKLEVKPFCNIDIGDIDKVKTRQIIKIDDETIAITSRAKCSQTQIITYNFKNNKNKVLMKVSKDENVYIDAYYPKQNLIVIAKCTNLDKKEERDFNYLSGLDYELKNIKDIYLAEIKEDKVEIFYKLKNKANDNQIYAEPLVTINEKGTEIFVQRYFGVIKDNLFKSENLTNEFITIKK